MKIQCAASETTYSMPDATKQKTSCFTYFQWQLVNKNRILIQTEQNQAPTLF